MYTVPVSCKMCLVDAQFLGTRMGPLTKITESIKNSIVESDLYPTPRLWNCCQYKRNEVILSLQKHAPFGCSWGQTLVVSELAFSVCLLSIKLVIFKNFVNVFCLKLSVLHLPYDELLKTLTCIFLCIYYPHVNFQLGIFSQVSLWYIFPTLKSLSHKYTVSQCQ